MVRLSGIYTQALQYDGNNNPIYIGQAIHGASKAAPVWQIRKLTFDASNNVTDIQFASGSASFGAVWDDRATLAYS